MFFTQYSKHDIDKFSTDKVAKIQLLRIKIHFTKF